MEKDCFWHEDESDEKGEAKNEDRSEHEREHVPGKIVRSLTRDRGSKGWRGACRCKGGVRQVANKF
jgi:hypothetical protein